MVYIFESATSQRANETLYCRSGTSFENFAVFCIQRLAAPDCEGEVESETGVKAYPAIFALEGV